MYNFTLTEEIKDSIRANCNKTPDIESCGLVIYTGFSYKVYPAENAAKNKQDFFIISPLDYLMASSFGLVVACYHSHIGENIDFSIFDKINCKNHGISFILYHQPSGLFKIISNKDILNYNEYKEFSLGVNDCYTLVKDYYKQEKNIELPPIFRQEGWENEWPPEIFEKFYSETGFLKIDDLKEARKDDIICFDYFNLKKPSHFAVYLENNYIFHHPRGKFVQISLLTDPEIRKILFLLRHKE